MKILTKVVIFSSAMSLLTGCSLFGKKSKKEEPKEEITYEEFKEVVLDAIQYEKDNLVENKYGTTEVTRYQDGFVRAYVKSQNYTVWSKCTDNYSKIITCYPSTEGGEEYFNITDYSSYSTDPYVLMFGIGQFGIFPAALAAKESGIEYPYDQEREYTNIYKQGNEYHIQYDEKIYYDESSYTTRTVETRFKVANNGSFEEIQNPMYGKHTPKYGQRSSAPADIIAKFEGK